MFIFFFPIPFLETITRKTNRYGNKDWVRPVASESFDWDDDNSISDGDDGGSGRNRQSTESKAHTTSLSIKSPQS
jgi:hypothetical protein